MAEASRTTSVIERCIASPFGDQLVGEYTGCWRRNAEDVLSFLERLGVTPDLQAVGARDQYDVSPGA